MTHTTVGIRELKTHLSRYIRQVKAGHTVVITERNKPVGRLTPLQPSLAVRLQRLGQEGVIAWSGRRLSPTAPMAPVRGSRSVADLLLEDRA